jgi:class 3 adenylate cyclase
LSIRSHDGDAPPDFILGWADELERGRWPGYILDAELRLRFVSSELRLFLSNSLGRELDDDDAGIGRNIFEALLNEAWSSAINPESLARLMPRTMGYLKDEFADIPDHLERYVPEAMMPFYESAEPQPSGKSLLAGRFDYTVPELPSLPIEFLLSGLRDRDGRLLGVVGVTQMGVRPTLVSLLARGDERMFQRMAELQEPARCQGAILFADLQGSSRLSRILPTSTYFSVIRALATEADKAIAANDGVVGRHAGDGVSGFFLLSQGEDASGVAASAITAAHTIHDRARESLRAAVEGAGLQVEDYGMNIGLHWGASLYMGQLVPGGRLDVTALGDSVNECARIQEVAENGSVWASKQLLEQLSSLSADKVGIDLDTQVYRPISELENVSVKSVRDAGLIPVTRLA